MAALQQSVAFFLLRICPTCGEYILTQQLVVLLPAMALLLHFLTFLCFQKKTKQNKKKILIFLDKKGRPGINTCMWVPSYSVAAPCRIHSAFADDQSTETGSCAVSRMDQWFPVLLRDTSVTASVQRRWHSFVMLTVEEGITLNSRKRVNRFPYIAVNDRQNSSINNHDANILVS